VAVVIKKEKKEKMARMLKGQKTKIFFIFVGRGHATIDPSALRTAKADQLG
jgi:hypothetical protein